MVRARSRERDWDMRDTGPGSREGAAGTERAPHLATTKTRDILASSRTRSVNKRISIRTSRVLCARDCLQWTTLIPSQSTLWVSSDHHRPRSASDMIPLSPGIIALSPTQLVTPGLSPSWSLAPSAWRWGDPAAPQEGDMSELWEFGPGREKKQDTVAETRRERRAVEDVTWHMTWARCQAPESAQSPVVTRISWLLSGWETFTADEFPVTGSRSIPGPGSLLQSRRQPWPLHKERIIPQLGIRGGGVFNFNFTHWHLITH